jgi:hypothetical protein
VTRFCAKHAEEAVTVALHRISGGVELHIHFPQHPAAEESEDTENYVESRGRAVADAGIDKST